MRASHRNVEQTSNTKPNPRPPSAKTRPNARFMRARNLPKIVVPAYRRVQSPHCSGSPCCRGEREVGERPSPVGDHAPGSGFRGRLGALRVVRHPGSPVRRLHHVRRLRRHRIRRHRCPHHRYGRRRFRCHRARHRELRQRPPLRQPPGQRPRHGHVRHRSLAHGHAREPALRRVRGPAPRRLRHRRLRHDLLAGPAAAAVGHPAAGRVPRRHRPVGHRRLAPARPVRQSGRPDPAVGMGHAGLRHRHLRRHAVELRRLRRAVPRRVRAARGRLPPARDGDVRSDRLRRSDRGRLRRPRRGRR